MSPARRSFASDNCASVHPAVLAAIARANVGHATSYGGDRYSAEVRARVAHALGAPDASVYFVFNGTGANVLCLRAGLRPWEAAIVSADAHLYSDEAGAPEAVGGIKLLSGDTRDGKLSARGIERMTALGADEHFAKPGLVSLTQSSELGTVYGLEELRALSELAHAHGLWVHMDGARLANAACALSVGLDQLVRGVDLLSFGGTKNGLLGGEAVVVFNPALDEGMGRLRKQTLQLASKTRFIAAQFDALLTDDLWAQNAGHANAMAARLARALQGVDQVRLTHEPAANAVFARIPTAVRDRLLEQFDFYDWDAEHGEVRWMCSWDTSEVEVDEFAAAVRAAVVACASDRSGAALTGS